MCWRRRVIATSTLCLLAVLPVRPAMAQVAAPAQSAAPAQTNVTARDAGAGGLAFVSDPAITIESQEIVLSAGEIKVTYGLRNTGAAGRTIMTVFQLPDLDAALIGDQPVRLANVQSPNFVAAAIVIDGSQPPVEVEQRALVLGLDVTALLTANQITLMPFDKAAAAQLRRLPKAVRTDFLQRGIVRAEDERIEPNWALKTTAYWRQSFPPRKTVTIALTYKPVSATAVYDSALIETLKAAHCLDSTLEAAVTRRIAAQNGNVSFSWLTYTPGTAASALGPARRLKLRIEKRDIGTIVATCRQGLRPLGPTTLEWTAQDYALEEEVHVLYID